MTSAELKKLLSKEPPEVEAFRKVSRAYMEQVTKTPQSAVKELQKVGILDESGELAPRYK